MTKSKLSIGIRDLRVSTLIGAYPHERHENRELLINLEMEICGKGISISDDLCDTVDYSRVASELSKWMKTQSSHLLEHLGHLTILKVFEMDSRIVGVHLEILKLGCILNAAGAVVKMSYFRNE